LHLLEDGRFGVENLIIASGVIPVGGGAAWHLMAGDDEYIGMETLGGADACSGSGF
jgi:hypothetical protein